MTEGSFATRSKIHREVRHLPFHRNWERGALSPLMFTVQRDSSRSLRKTFLDHIADKMPIWYSKEFIYISKRVVSIYCYKFSKVSAQRGKKRSGIFLYFQQKKIKPLLICICPYRYLLSGYFMQMSMVIEWDGEERGSTTLSHLTLLWFV